MTRCFSQNYVCETKLGAPSTSMFSVPKLAKVKKCIQTNFDEEITSGLSKLNQEMYTGDKKVDWQI